MKSTHAQQENSLQARAIAADRQLQEHYNALSALQQRYEQRTHTISSLRQEKEALTAAVAASERKRETNVAEIAALKERNANLDSDLRISREMLQASTTPGLAEFERANGEIRRLQAENANFEKKLAAMKTDFDFTRTAYQTASSAAVESANQVTMLETEMAALRTKASSTVVEIAEINQRTENDALRNETIRLEATLAEREEILRRKEEEIKELRRGRGIGTRGSSVLPGGSPRGSRGASPVAGEPMLRVGSKGLGSSLRYGTKGPGIRLEDEA